MGQLPSSVERLFLKTKSEYGEYIALYSNGIEKLKKK